MPNPQKHLDNRLEKAYTPGRILFFMAHSESSHEGQSQPVLPTTGDIESPVVPFLATSPLGGILRPGFTPEDVTRMQPQIETAMNNALEALRRQAGQTPPSPEDPSSH